MRIEQKQNTLPDEEKVELRKVKNGLIAMKRVLLRTGILFLCGFLLLTSCSSSRNKLRYPTKKKCDCGR
jgi:hypothetical protein